MKLLAKTEYNLLISGPFSVERTTELDDEVDVEVDVEQCSDSEGNFSRTTRTLPAASPLNLRSDEDRLTPEQVPVS